MSAVYSINRPLLPSLLWSAGFIQAHALDRDDDGMCDVWEARFHAGAIAAGDDAYGDGFSNLQEALAGTNEIGAIFPNLPRIDDPFAVSTANLAFL